MTGSCGIVRLHNRLRKALFTPIDVKMPDDILSEKSVGRVRITEGMYADGRKVYICDDWTKPRNAHRALETLWVGTTTFLDEREPGAKTIMQELF